MIPRTNLKFELPAAVSLLQSSRISFTPTLVDPLAPENSPYKTLSGSFVEPRYVFQSSFSCVLFAGYETSHQATSQSGSLG